MKSKSQKRTRSVNAPHVFLDTVGIVRRRNAYATLRLKIVGPVEKLEVLKMQEGDRLRVFEQTVALAA
ncbi:hypothetical protein [Oleiharenicola lentus]|uniref:hypothetical protein n=1 Tax=Oleiharenicola lentus TaxID=2508720 RepID=UPI003F66278F